MGLQNPDSPVQIRVSPPKVWFIRAGYAGPDSHTYTMQLPVMDSQGPARFPTYRSQRGAWITILNEGPIAGAVRSLFPGHVSYIPTHRPNVLDACRLC